jgi:hypothetical protein
MNHHNDGFDEVVQNFNNEGPYQAGHTDPGPYGIPVNSIPTKPGLTKRGKAAIAVGTAVLATGGLIFWQHNAAAEAASQAKQQEYQLEKAKLDLEMLKEVNRANEKTSTAKNSAETERQKQISACVNADKGLVGKQLGVTYSSVLKDCQAQFPAGADGSDMQNAASASDSNGGGSGVNSGLLIGGAALVGGVLLVARKRTSASNAQ